MQQRFKREVEDLQRRFGIEEREAQAFWHLTRARVLMIQQWQDRMEEADEPTEERTAESIGAGFWEAVSARTMFETRVLMPFTALIREIGAGVLRRDYPDGWALGFDAMAEEEEPGQGSPDSRP